MEGKKKRDRPMCPRKALTRSAPVPGCPFSPGPAIPHPGTCFLQRSPMNHGSGCRVLHGQGMPQFRLRWTRRGWGGTPPADFTPLSLCQSRLDPVPLRPIPAGTCNLVISLPSSISTHGRFSQGSRTLPFSGHPCSTVREQPPDPELGLFLNPGKCHRPFLSSLPFRPRAQSQRLDFLSCAQALSVSLLPLSRIIPE